MQRIGFIVVRAFSVDVGVLLGLRTRELGDWAAPIVASLSRDRAGNPRSDRISVADEPLFAY